MTTTPHTEGFYWAKQIATDWNVELSDSWEVVNTFDNGGPVSDLRVFVPGLGHSEPASHFVWGPRVIRPAGCDA